MQFPMPPEHHVVTSAAEIVVGGVLMAAPWWFAILAQVNFFLGCISVLCGAILGIAGVMRLFRRKKAAQ